MEPAGELKKYLKLSLTLNAICVLFPLLAHKFSSVVGLLVLPESCPKLEILLSFILYLSPIVYLSL